MMALDWRVVLLLFIIGLLLVSCTGHLISSDATAMLMPSITLTVHLSQTLTATPIGISTALMMPTATPIDEMNKLDGITLNLPSPICYEDDFTGILCLGVVHNPYQTAFQDIQVLVELFKPNGVLFASQTTALLQHTLPPRGSAPYHIQLAQSVQDFGAVRVSVVKLTPLSQSIAPPNYSMRDVQNAQADDRYQVTGKLIGNQPDSGGGIRMIITLYDAYEHVAGYRVLEIPEMPIREDMPFHFDFVPKIRGTDLRYTIYLEHIP
ncbi:MAG: hypothetical protein KJ043_01515 [Anaerolineae bacterium]|nr:hypothetical protein [Anaerolineae bacterium]